ncbi:ATP-binding protein [Rhodococcus sp. Z13]|uniref:ATP-binding protein n=1 Tax=Rhodococcus sacchari TaxID=2962047 RepID=A0ACD4DI90_9NOCA|nr:sensor histidine kinase [Rhodococcus sp. Z13]UYP19757.1 ATP-binding protein [Rhodococcus sp. Z13]
MFVRFVSIGYLCYLVLLVPAIVAQAQLTAPWWTPVAVFAIFGSGAALGLESFRSVTRIKRVAAVNALAYPVVVALWFVAWNGAPASPDDSLWFTLFPGVASFAAVAAWRPRWAVVHMLVAVLLAQSANHVVREAPFSSFLAPDLAFALTFCSLFLAAAVVALGTGRTLDDTIATTHATAAAAAAAEARNAERERFDALVHDRVMSTLLAAARRAPQDSLVQQARRAVDEIDELRAGTDIRTRIDAGTVLARLRSAATEVDEDIAFTVRVDPDCDGTPFPPEPVSVTAAAVAEAVRNSLRHAGSNATRTVDVDIAPRRIAVQVVDDGKGFDPDAVDPHRLGLEVSIRGRMRQLDGGRAVVESTPGAGTRVMLSWQEPAA